MRKSIGGLACACAAALLLGASHASAATTVIFSDNFDAETVPSPPNWIANDASFANFFVGGGTVDLLGPGNPFGLTGVGNFVDLDGSTGQGGFLETIQQFDFHAGDRVTLNILAGGNQRQGTDTLFAGFRFFTPRDIAGVTTSGFTSTQTPDTPSQLLLGIVSLPSTAAYQTYSVSFVAPVSGRVSAVVGTDSADNIGPLLDLVQLTSVPEPATWALSLVGFGLLGATLRRRRPALA